MKNFEKAILELILICSMCEIDRSSKSQIFLGDIETNFHDSLKQIPKK